MTTPPTPAGWYPDPEQAGALRYWDGATWTEHRSPAQAPAAPEPPRAPWTPEPPAEPAPQAGAEHVGSHRAPEPESEPLSVTEQPTTKVPLRDWTPEPPPELRDWACEPVPEPTTKPEPTTDPDPRAILRATAAAADRAADDESASARLDVRGPAGAAARARSLCRRHDVDAARAAGRRTACGHRAAAPGRQPQADHGVRRRRRRTAAGFGPRRRVRVRHPQARRRGPSPHQPPKPQPPLSKRRRRRRRPPRPSRRRRHRSRVPSTAR